jgi:hypothetical protein
MPWTRCFHGGSGPGISTLLLPITSCQLILDFRGEQIAKGRPTDSRAFIICARPELWYRYSPRHHFPRLILADISPRRRRIVREDREPLLGDRLRVIFLLALDRL